MRRSEIRAKQIAHNQLHGSPDEDLLRQMVGQIDNVDDLLTTGLPEDFLPTVEADSTSLNLPHADFDWRMVTLLFLPTQLKEWGRPRRPGQAHRQPRLRQPGAVRGLRPGRAPQRLAGHIRNMATAIAVLTDLARREVEQMEADGVTAGGTWTRTATILGPELPPDAAKIVTEAIERVCQDAGISQDEPWKALEMLAADYLAGS